MLNRYTIPTVYFTFEAPDVVPKGVTLKFQGRNLDATEDNLNIVFQPLNIEACQVLNLHSNDDGTVEIQMDLKHLTVTSI